MADEAQMTEQTESSPAESGPVDEIEQIRNELEAERARSKENFDQWQRTAADFSNYRKRLEQERNDLSKLASQALIGETLGVVDDLERAIKTIPQALYQFTWFDGVMLIHHRLLSVLNRYGLEPIAIEQGAEFDPAVHEAILEGEGETGKIIEVFQSGYKLHGKVLRPALVKVGKKGSQES